MKSIEVPRLKWVGRLETTSTWRLKAHQHDFHQLVVVTSGIEHVAIGAETLSASAGDVLFYPAGVQHEEWADARRPFRSHWVSFYWNACPPLTPFQAHDSTGRMRQIIAWMFAQRDANSAQALAAQSAYLQALFFEYLQENETRGEQHKLVPAVQTYVHDHLAEKISLQALAQENNMSKYHFLRTYKALTQRTPMEEVRIMRLRRAEEMIIGTDLPLKEIAVRCGLGNVYLLSRLFRKQFGLPPSELRRGRK